MPSRRSFFDQRRSRVAFCLITKERVYSTKTMLPALIGEGDYDLLWVDGSRSPEGRNLPTELAPDIPRLQEIHWDVTGGPDAAIVYALSRMLELGYDYFGLIENDIGLQPGWFDRLLNLYRLGARDGLRVGAVSARTFVKRILFLRREYAVLFNCGAAMILLTRDAARCLLNRYRTTTFEEVRDRFLFTSHRDILPLSDFRDQYAEPLKVHTTADWFYDAALLLDGYCSLGLVPSMGADLDPRIPHIHGPFIQAAPARFSPEEEAAFEAFLTTHRRQAVVEQRPLTSFSGTFLRRDNAWVVFPHQCLALKAAETAGSWRIRWHQGWGPFLYETAEPNARVTITVFGPCSLLVFTDNRSGLIEVNLDGRAQLIDLFSAKSEIVGVSIGDPPSAAKKDFHRVQITFRGASNPAASEPCLSWYGLNCQEIQPWFSPETSFDIGTLRPYLPS